MRSCESIYQNRQQKVRIFPRAKASPNSPRLTATQQFWPIYQNRQQKVRIFPRAKASPNSPRLTATQQFWQLRDVRRDPPRLIASARSGDVAGHSVARTASNYDCLARRERLGRMYAGRGLD
jgi:hypothetical protein